MFPLFPRPAAHPLRQVLLAVSRSERAERLVTSSPLTRGVVRRYVADDVGAVVDELTRKGLLVTVDHLGEEVADPAQAEGTVRAYLALLGRLFPGADVSIKLTALGLRLSERLALDNAATVCEAAARHGVTVTLDAEEHDTIDALMSIHSTLRKEHPDVGVVVQAYLPEAAERCRRLDGARVRLCKGAYEAPTGLAGPRQIDRSFVRCMRILMAGDAYPMIATHDPRLIEIASTLAVLHGRDASGFEYQMLYGVRPDEQERLARLGQRVRVYVPYGSDWYAYLMRRLAERPANLRFLLRSLLSRR
ncbi:proline dehydrogenase family protein [Thermoactinospora rubra]|uniref:proline dehydrogenase family protein n=1 Tax=Thermoactinospora rubra TaxID=1088767 RepID=UPI001F0B4B97|nr:proline dehydrogenase family protein [Thermoactinospora rubra]